MRLLYLLSVSLAIANLVSAGLFAEDSFVRMIGHKEFKAAIEENVRPRPIADTLFQLKGCLNL